MSGHGTNNPSHWNVCRFQSATADPSAASEDRVAEKEVAEAYVQEVRGLAVRALYPYQSKTFSMARGELLELKEKSNEEWWLVESAGGREGFAPATYLKEVLFCFHFLFFV